MKKILSLAKLSRVFKTFPVDYPQGVLTLTSATGKHQFFIKELRFVEYRPSEKSIPTEIGRRFAVHELISRQPPKLESYAELWDWLDVPEVFRFHKERFRDVVHQTFLRAILDIDFEEGLPIKFKPGEIEVETDFLPAIQLHRFAADVLRNSDTVNDYEAFSPETIFVVGRDLPPEISFESLLIYQLLKEPKSFLEILDSSFYPPNKTIECIRELLRYEALVQMGGGVEFNFSSLSESLEQDKKAGKAEPDDSGSEEDFDIDIFGAEKKEEIEDKKLSQVVEENLAAKQKAVQAKKRVVTDDYLLSSLSYLVFFLMLALPWFLWVDLLRAFE